MSSFEYYVNYEEHTWLLGLFTFFASNLQRREEWMSCGIRPFVHPSVCPSICLSIHLFVHPSVCPSIHLFKSSPLLLIISPSDYNDDFYYGDDDYNYGDDDYNYGDDHYNYGDDDYNYGDDDCNYGDDDCNYGDDDYNYGDDDCNYVGDDDDDYSTRWKSSTGMIAEMCSRIVWARGSCYHVTMCTNKSQWCSTWEQQQHWMVVSNDSNCGDDGDDVMIFKKKTDFTINIQELINDQVSVASNQSLGGHYNLFKLSPLAYRAWQ